MIMRAGCARDQDVRGLGRLRTGRHGVERGQLWRLAVVFAQLVERAQRLMRGGLQFLRWCVPQEHGLPERGVDHAFEVVCAQVLGPAFGAVVDRGRHVRHGGFPFEHGECVLVRVVPPVFAQGLEAEPVAEVPGVVPFGPPPSALRQVMRYPVTCMGEWQVSFCWCLSGATGRSAGPRAGRGG